MLHLSMYGGGGWRIADGCVVTPNALVQLQARYHHCGEAASEKCLSAATLVRPRTGTAQPVPRLRRSASRATLSVRRPFGPPREVKQAPAPTTAIHPPTSEYRHCATHEALLRHAFGKRFYVGVAISHHGQYMTRITDHSYDGDAALRNPLNRSQQLSVM